MSVTRVNLGMKREGIIKLHEAITAELRRESDHFEIELYGDVDEHGAVLTISNDDMERDEVPADAIYVEVEE